ncbi:MAG: Flp family type IVb pilin [Hyphomicrobiaceae bacterium]
MRIIGKFAKCDSGATAIEYGLIAGLIAVFCIAAITSVGTGIGNTFNTASDAMN